jgi:hypothetical protein
MEIIIAQQVLTNAILEKQNELDALQMSLDILKETFTSEFLALENLTVENNAFAIEKNALAIEKNALAIENNALMNECEALKKEIATKKEASLEIPKGDNNELLEVTSIQ